MAWKNNSAKNCEVEMARLEIFNGFFRLKSQ